MKLVFQIAVGVALGQTFQAVVFWLLFLTTASFLR